VSVVEVLKNITDIEAPDAEDKLKVLSPETMQDSPMSESDSEGGELIMDIFVIIKNTIIIIRRICLKGFCPTSTTVIDQCF